jgi:hypothetical protein
MTDHDQLLAQADDWLEWCGDPEAEAVVRGLVEALRAALAARPQPDPRLRSIVADLAHTDPRHFTAVETLRARAIQTIGGRAVAGSATPTDGDSVRGGPSSADEASGLVHEASTSGSMPAPGHHAAGSATPTGDDTK